MPDETLSTTKPLTPAPGQTGMATVPPSNAGQRMKGIVLANLGMNILLKAAETLPQGSDERVVVIEALAKLEKRFQGSARDLTGQEVKLAGASANPAPTASPEQQLAMSRAQAQQRMAQMAPAMSGAA